MGCFINLFGDIDMKKNTLITIEEVLLEKIRDISKKETRSLNGQLNHFLQQSVDQWVLNDENQSEKN